MIKSHFATHNTNNLNGGVYVQLEQTSIINFLDNYQAEVWLQLQGLKLNEVIHVSSFLVRLTTKRYEIENRTIHIGFLNLKQC